MKRQRWSAGAILRIKLPDGFYSYARLLRFPDAAFYDYRAKEEVQSLEEIISKPVLFTVPIHKSALTREGWEIIGKLPLQGPLLGPRLYFLQDRTNLKACRIIDENDNIRNATPEECEGLERAAVWEPEHIEDRLMDHYAGRPNKWVESLKLQRE